MPNNHGGKRKGAGRPKRTAPKSAPIWCGQIDEMDRKIILDNLTPRERLDALFAAVELKWAERSTSPPPQ